MPFEVEIHLDAEQQLDVLELPPSMREELISTLLCDLENLPDDRLDREERLPVVLRRHTIAMPVGDSLHHFTFLMMTNPRKRMVCRVEYRVTTGDC